MAEDTDALAWKVFYKQLDEQNTGKYKPVTVDVEGKPTVVPKGSKKQVKAWEEDHKWKSARERELAVYAWKEMEAEEIQGKALGEKLAQLMYTRDGAAGVMMDQASVLRAVKAQMGDKYTEEAGKRRLKEILGGVDFDLRKQDFHPQLVKQLSERDDVKDLPQKDKVGRVKALAEEAGLKLAQDAVALKYRANPVDDNIPSGIGIVIRPWNSRRPELRTSFCQGFKIGWDEVVQTTSELRSASGRA